MREHVAWSHELRQPADPRSPARVRAFVAQHLLAHGRHDLIEPVRLVASELATNAVLHSGTEFVVTLLEEHDTVYLSVEDDRPQLRPSLQAASPTSEGGRGLSLVDMVSHQWGVSTEGAGSKAVWASFAAGPHAGGEVCTCRSSHPSAGRANPATLRLVSPEG